ncbi:MAG: polysaccharide deacetylase family protein [Bryobacteraceae bacterium]|nr:polysaccharide deacetylase family protein [Bryobacteraceae bacterium]
MKNETKLTRRAMLMGGGMAAATAMAQGPAAGAKKWAWPDGKRMAVSLSFDDARLSQADVGFGVLEKLGLKATFYALPGGVERRLEAWKGAVKAGHEIGHHSFTHACTANYRRTNALEDWTLERMGADLDKATARLEELLGVKPVSFAYPCGQKFVGRGAATRSYVPLIAERFLCGRGYMDEAANDPEVCDLAALMGIHFDETPFAGMKKVMERAARDGRWVIFAGHEIGKLAFQTTDTEALAELAAYVKDPANGIWVGTVGEIARYVREQRG